MRIAVITDTHWGVRNDSPEFLDYFTRYYEQQFFPYLKKHGIEHILHLGDVVDRRKYVNYVTARRFRTSFIEPGLSRGYRYDFVVGNHDAPLRNSNDVNAMWELVGRESSNVRVFPEATEVAYDSCQILLMPWIHSGNVGRSTEVMNSSKAQMMFGHLEIRGFEMYRGVTCNDGFDRTMFDKFDVVASGHFHRKTTAGNIHYLGAPYEMTWADYDDTRGFHVFDTDTREFEYVQNNQRMFRKLWYDDGSGPAEVVDFTQFRNTFVKVVVINKTSPAAFETYIEGLVNAGPYDVQVVDDHNNKDLVSDASAVENAEDTPAIIAGYVSAMETYRVDKTALETLLKTLYVKAVSMENVE